jgi:hypothetical protein
MGGPRFIIRKSETKMFMCSYIFNGNIIEIKWRMEADVIWDNCPNYIKEKLEHINYEAARIITGATKLTSMRIFLQECGWECSSDLRSTLNFNLRILFNLEDAFVIISLICVVQDPSLFKFKLAKGSKLVTQMVG